MKKRLIPRFGSVLGTLVFFGSLVSGASAAAQLYYSNSGADETINTVDGDGNSQAILVDLNTAFAPTTSFIARGITTDSQSLFWVDGAIQSVGVYRSSFSGGGATQIVDIPAALGAGTYSPQGITTDGQNLFWTDNSTESIFTSSLSGNGAFELIDLDLAFGAATYDPLGIGTDGNFIYWADEEQDGIFRAAINGGIGLTQIVDFNTDLAFRPPGFFPRSLTVENGMVYWIDSAQDAVFRSDINGGNVTLLFEINAVLGTNLNYSPSGLTSDGTFLYWTELQGNDAIYRVALDGTGAVKILDEPGSPAGAHWIVATQIPEPSASGLLLCIGAMTLLRRRRRE